MSILKRKNLNRSRTFFFVLLVFCLLFLLGLAKEVVSRHQIDRQIKDLEQETALLSEENSQLSSLLDSWSDSNQLEKEARIKLGLQKPGEKVVMVIRDDQLSDQPVDGDYQKRGNSIVVVPKTNFNPINWWKYFFN